MSEQGFSFVVRHVLEGGVVVYPTDTLYALGASVYDERAVKNVFEIKRRPFGEPLPVAVASKEELEEVVFLNDVARKLVDVFLPGPLTLVLRRKNIPSVVTGGKSTVGVRIPRNDKALRLLSETGPLTVTSANLHGMRVFGSVEEILKQLGVSLPAVDDGVLMGKPSTVVDLTQSKPVVVREGVVSKGRLMEVLGYG